MKNKHRIKQGLSLLLAGGIALTNLGAVMPAFAEDAAATPETAEAATPESAEANVPTPNLSQITENLYNDLPDAPTGSYLGSMGLPVATGETKIGISAWVSDLYDGVDAHMDADALNADENTVTIGKTPGTDYAIVPLLAQVEYPADGAVSEIILPDGVELLSYLSTDYEPIPADEQEQAEILHQTYSEQSAAATGLYVKASADFTAQLVYTDSDGNSQSKSIQVQISEDATPTHMQCGCCDERLYWHPKTNQWFCRRCGMWAKPLRAEETSAAIAEKLCWLRQNPEIIHTPEGQANVQSVEVALLDREIWQALTNAEPDVDALVAKILHRAEMEYKFCTAGDADPVTLQIQKACAEYKPTEEFPETFYKEVISKVILYRDTHIEFKLQNGQIV